MKNKVLILGASGFIGNTIYKELVSYFDVFGTYCTSRPDFNENQVLFQFDVTKDSILPILKKIKPNYIISSLRGDYKSQYKIHREIKDYIVSVTNCKILYLSTANVFDAKFEFPSYENDIISAESEYGKFKASIEKLIQTLPESNYSILRLPIVIGVNAPRIFQLKQANKHHANFEVFPNLIISITTVDKIAQQVHYIINKNRIGIFHLSTNDVIHHNDLFEEISDRLELKDVIFKNVYSSNEDSYLAILPKDNKLPKNYRITVAQVIEACILKNEIVTLKK